MNHADAYEARVIRYADGDMDQAEATVFQEHLAGCNECAAALNGHRDALRFVQTALRNAPVGNTVEPDRVRARVSLRRRRIQVVTASACGLLIIAGVVDLARAPNAETPVAVDSLSDDDVELAAIELQIATLRHEVAVLNAEAQRSTELAALEANSEYSEIAAIAVSAAQHLEDSGLDVEGARRQYEYVAEFYSDTPAAAIARQRLAEPGPATQSI